MELHAQIACAMPRELARKGIGWQDRAVYTEAIYYGRENLSDGVIARGELAFWMPDMPVKERTRRLDALRDKGALLDHPEGWAFPDHVWRKWGKTRAEVMAQREAEAKRKADYRAKVSQRDKDGTDSRAAHPSATPKPYPEPKPKPKPKPNSVSSVKPNITSGAALIDLTDRMFKDQEAS